MLGILLTKEEFILKHIKWLVFERGKDFALCEVGANSLNIIRVRFIHPKSVPRFRRLVAGLSSRSHAFDPTSVHVRFVVDEVTLGHISVRVVRFCPVSIIPAHHIQLHLHVVRKGGRTLKPGNLP